MRHRHTHNPNHSPVGFDRRRGSTTREAFAPVVLAVILGLCLLGAQALVMSRSDLPNAIENGRLMLETLQSEGLRSRLKDTSMSLYFLRRQHDTPIGFGAYRLREETDDNGNVYFEGKTLDYNARSSLLTESTFKTANDLGSYEIQEWDYHQRGRVTEFTQEFTGNSLVTIYEGLKETITDRQMNMDNLICPPLLDILTSIAAGEDYPDGVVFSLAFVEPSRKRRRLTFELRCWQQTPGEVPASIREQHPDGQSVSIRWLSQDGFHFQNQNLYYDRQHRLIWQEDLSADDRPETLHVTRAVSREELLDAFPEAQPILQEWQQESAPALEQEDSLPVL